MADRGMGGSTVKKVAALAAVLLGSLVVAAPAASAAPQQSAVGDFGGCLASQREGDLLLMIDESGSLQVSDPEAARVSAANYLLEQLSSFGGSAGVALDVSVAGFSDDFTVHAPWTRLDGGSLPALQDEVDRFRSRTNGVDTDYWAALDGARGALADRSSTAANRCQAVAWFSDGKLDFTTRDAEKPYAPGVSLGTDAGVQQIIAAARESICRPAGIADQLRSSGIVTFAVGLAAGTAQAGDFDLMRSIATGEPAAGQACGNRTSPRPGDFYLAQNIDDLLFAFDAFSSPGQAPLENETGVCVGQVCEEAQHRFVLDNSIGSVTVLGFADADGLVPTLVSPDGAELAMPRDNAPRSLNVDGVGVDYRWLSARSVSFTMRQPALANPGQWQGMWALVFVDPDGSDPAARSKSNIHISGNLFPAWLGQDVTAIHSGEKTSAIQLGIVDSDRREIDPSDLLGSAYLSVSLVDSARVAHELASRIPKNGIDEPIELDLTSVPPGEATLRLALEVTTADARTASGTVIAPGTQLAPQYVDVPLTVAPPVGYPTLPNRIDFGTVEGSGRFPVEIPVGGPGCVWLDSAEPIRIDAVPDGVGDVALVNPAATSAERCLAVEEGAQGALTVELDVPEAGNGSLNGSVRMMMAPAGELDRAMPVDVPFTAELQKPLDSGRFLLAFLLTLFLGIAIPLALLYVLKWRASRIPAETLKAQRFSVTIADGAVLRDGVPFTLRDGDLTEIVRNLDKPARLLTADGVKLEAKTGLSPVGTGYVRVKAGGLLGSSGAKPDHDPRTGEARLPLAVHNDWVILHDPAGPADHASVLLLVGAGSNPVRLIEDLNRRAPGAFARLRERVGSDDTATPGTGAPDGRPAPQSSFDPFGAPTAPPAPTFGAPPAFGGSSGFGAAPHRGSSSSAAPAAQPFDPFRPPGA
ncbi:vWA domain-containing protein [Rhodococcus aetherivorans]|uniref:vWA domain-containing protein n=1 Tax=Rhodococcus aetherivorans TaxID=191292 RepID=UPI003675087D